MRYLKGIGENMKKSQLMENIMQEISGYAKKIDEAQLDELAAQIVKAGRVYVAGAGRSGFCARAFSNRLMHLGLTVYFVGEPTTPAIGKGDLLVIGSGSGETASLLAMAEKAREVGAGIALITIFPESSIGGYAGTIVKVPGITPKSTLENTNQSIQPMGNVFEQLSWILYDAVTIMLMDKLNMSAAEMFTRHANLE